MTSTLRIRVLFIGLALVGCDGGGAAAEETSTLPTGAEIMRDTVQNSIVPAVLAFDAEAQDLLVDVDGFCASPNSDSLDDLQARWRSLSEAWSAVVPYDLGPLDDDVIVPKMIFFESMRQRGTDYTQTVREGIVRGVEGTDTLDMAYLDRQTFDEVGLLALEVLIFEATLSGESTEPADVVSDYESAPRKCDYLRGMSELLARDADDVARGWTESFGESGEPFADTMASNFLEDGTEPVVALLIAMQQHLDYVKARKLEGILDAQLSGHFYPNVLATLEAMEQLLEQPLEESFGLFERMEATDAGDVVEQVRSNFDDAKAAANAEDREALGAAIGRLEGNLKVEIPDALGVELGISFSDGD